MAFCGRVICFHGAFKNKTRALRKEREREGSYILKRQIRGQTRYIVATEKGR